MTKKQILIVGPAGPQGKTTLKEALKKKGYDAVELYDLIDECRGRHIHEYSVKFFNGLAEGYVVINFTGKPYLKKCDPMYEIPEEELQKYIDYIEDRK